MKKDSKKKYIILFAIIGGYLIFAFFLFGPDLIKKGMSPSYLFLDPTTRWKYSNGGWTNVSDVREYNNLNFETYGDNTRLGEFSIVYNEKFYLFDENKLSQKYNGKLLAYRGKIKLDVIQYEPEEIEETDYPIIDMVLKENSIAFDITKTIGNKIKVDINNDGKIETIYNVYNVFSSYVKDKAFGIVFTIKDNKIEYIYKNIDAEVNMISNMCTPSIHHIVDIDQDKQYEIIIKCDYFSKKGTCNYLYGNDKNNFELLKGC